MNSLLKDDNLCRAWEFVSPSSCLIIIPLWSSYTVSSCDVIDSQLSLCCTWYVYSNSSWKHLKQNPHTYPERSILSYSVPDMYSFLCDLTVSMCVFLYSSKNAKNPVSSADGSRSNFLNFFFIVLSCFQLSTSFFSFMSRTMCLLFVRASSEFLKLLLFNGSFFKSEMAVLFVYFPRFAKLISFIDGCRYLCNEVLYFKVTI